jgi:hypothetical protein
MLTLLCDLDCDCDAVRVYGADHGKYNCKFLACCCRCNTFYCDKHLRKIFLIQNSLFNYFVYLEVNKNEGLILCKMCSDSRLHIINE